MSNNQSLIKVLVNALKNDPENNDIKRHMAVLYLEEGEVEQALSLYQSILEKDSTDHESLKGALAAAKQLGDTTLIQTFELLLNTHKNTTSDEISNETDSPSETEKEAVEQADIVSLESSRIRGHKLSLVKGGGDTSEFITDVEDSTVYLKDVGGMEQVKKRIQLSFLAPLKNPELMKAYGKSVGGGLLLYGPPGCGKTFIARALAGELGAKFISIGISDILDMYIGESERKLHELFELARKSAPCVLFFDELDALAQKRSQLRNTGMRSLVNQFLAEMDSIGSDNQGVFILAATNHPWDIDSALRRPGRFDRVIAVFPPDAEARMHIFQYHLKNKPCGDLNLEDIVKKTEGYSGADIAHICDSSVDLALEESMTTGEVRPIVTQDVQHALKEVKASTRSWLEQAKNYAIFANENGMYDDLLEYINKVL